jgi:hypothetical protein
LITFIPGVIGDTAMSPFVKLMGFASPPSFSVSKILKLVIPTGKNQTKKIRFYELVYLENILMMDLADLNLYKLLGSSHFLLLPQLPLQNEACFKSGQK